MLHYTYLGQGYKIEPHLFEKLKSFPRRLFASSVPDQRQSKPNYILTIYTEEITNRLNACYSTNPNNWKRYSRTKHKQFRNLTREECAYLAPITRKDLSTKHIIALITNAIESTPEIS